MKLTKYIIGTIGDLALGGIQAAILCTLFILPFVLIPILLSLLK